MSEVRKVHQYDVFSTGAPIQEGIFEFLSNWEGQTHLDKLAESYTLLRNRLCDGLRDTAWSFTPAEGGYFQVLDYKAFEQRGDQDMVRQWTKQTDGIATIPLSSFYDPSHPMRNESTRVRICFAKQDVTLDLAIERLRKLAGA
jgi:methionine aminotransferase